MTRGQGITSYFRSQGITSYFRGQGITSYFRSQGITSYFRSQGITSYFRSQGITSYFRSQGITSYFRSQGITSYFRRIDGIPPEVIKPGKQTSLLEHLHNFLLQCWEDGTVPQDMRDANIITLSKNKGDRSDCNNYRGISLLSIVGKTFARVVLNRLQSLAERVYPEVQCGFRAERSTIDMIFSLRQLQEKCREQRRLLFIAFIDLAKAFDLVSRAGLFTLLQKIGCPPKLLRMHLLLRGHERHRPIRWLLLGPLSYQKRSETRMCPRPDTFRYPVLPAAALRLQSKKTNVLGQDVSSAPCISIGDCTLDVVEDFTYLGSTISSSLSLDTELNSRIGKASAAMARLSKRVWENSMLTIKTKTQVYQACVLSTLLYGSESWTLYTHQERRLNTFHLRCLRRILGISWQDRVRNKDVLARAGIHSMFALLTKRRLRWLGHVIPMQDGRLPKDILYGELATGSRPTGRPVLHYKEACKLDLKAGGIALAEFVADRSSWQLATRSTINTAEQWREEKWEEKRARRRQRAESVPLDDTVFTCNNSSRTCRSRIGLYSHTRRCSSTTD
ncbi:hypothetical protein ACOMHN_028026 [Nucella lapillus]